MVKRRGQVVSKSGGKPFSQTKKLFRKFNRIFMIFFSQKVAKERQRLSGSSKGEHHSRTLYHLAVHIMGGGGKLHRCATHQFSYLPYFRYH